MLVSYKWLNSYVDLSDVTPEELAEKLHVVELKLMILKRKVLN